jgi:hypothetical protein
MSRLASSNSACAALTSRGLAARAEEDPIISRQSTADAAFILVIDR